jgi:ubiquinone/menaquinone biosynthesis C-methylase UbiE
MTTGELAWGVKIRATDTVIDVGCGDGGHSYFCARQGAEVLFFDMDAAKLTAAEEKIKASPAHAYRAILSDCNPIPLPDATGGVIICTRGPEVRARRAL